MQNSESHPRRRIQTGPPDLLLLNAHVLTLEPGRPTAEAVAVREDTIAAIGTTGYVASLAGPMTRTINCNGKTLMPGFVDSHCHLLAMAAKLKGLDCSPKAAASIEELKQVLKRRADTTPTGRWIRGFSYDHLSLSERRHPSRWDLDQAAPNHPVRLDHRSGHATVLNSRALQIAGIDKATPDPVEGVIDRDTASGEPTGLLLELSGFLRQRLGMSGGQEEMEEGVLAMNDALLRYGITSVQDAGADNGLDRWQTFQSLQTSGKFCCRVTMMVGASRLAELQSEGLAWGTGDDWLRLGHVKVMLTLTTGALQPGEEALRDAVDHAHRSGFPVAIHAIEQEAVEASARMILESSSRREIPPTPLCKGGRGGISFSGSQPTFPSGQTRDRIEHCAECPPHLVDLVRAGGAMVVTQPGFVYWNGDDYLHRVEPSLLPHLYPVGALVKAGVPLAFGSDAPVIDPNPWSGIYSAVTRKTSGGNTLPPDHARSTQRQDVSVLEALRMYTIAGAYAEGSEGRKGTIQPGKLADLVLLDADPTEAAPAELKDIRALMTIVGGRVVWEG